MLIKSAVTNAQKRIGISTEQPSLSAQSILQIWTEAVSDSSSRPAFTCLGQTLSYGEIDQLSRRVASYLQKRLKLRAGDRIAIQLPNLIQYPVVAIAAMKLGLVIVNTNPMYSVRELVHQFNDAGVKAVIVLDQFYDVLSEAVSQTSVEHVIVTRPLDLMPSSRRVLLGGLMRLMGKSPRIKNPDVIDFKDLIAGGTSYSNHRASVNDICALQYTGGTTGASKGVMLTQSSLTANIAQALDVISVTAEPLTYSTTVLPLPLYHIYAYI